MTNIIRFPLERRRTAEAEVEPYVEIVTGEGLNTCPEWGHIWAMGDPTCLCGEKGRAFDPMTGFDRPAS